MTAARTGLDSPPGLFDFSTSEQQDSTQLVTVQDRFLDVRVPLKTLGVSSVDRLQIRIESVNQHARTGDAMTTLLYDVPLFR